MTTLVQNLFSASAESFPDKVAVSCQAEEATYRDIELFTNGVANHLASSGLERGQFVPVFMRKSINAIRAILAVLKSDCAYVPIDINTPRSRFEKILDACQPPLIIVDSEGLRLLESMMPAEELPKLFDIESFVPNDNRPRGYENLSIDVAYVLFTSGSTGVPKGVMIPHNAIVDYIAWCVDQYGLQSNDIIANHAPLYFDNSTFDIYTSFQVGGELHLVDDAVNAVIPSLVKWISSRKISTFFCVPSVLSMLLRSRRVKPDSFPNLRWIICAGEVLPPHILRQWMQMFPHIQFANMYGPTEITVDCSFHIFDSPPSSDTKRVPIGKARKNMELFVLDDAGQLTQSPGAVGELLVRGESVAYGYLGNPDKTQESFIQNPRHKLFPDRLYRTGDNVEIGENGDYFFLGRSDDQIKYLGYRIELGEIEAALSGIEGIDECVVVFKDSEAESEKLIAAMIGSCTTHSASTVSSQLRDTLPDYMVPTLINVTAESLPKTPNGKYDRQSIKSQLFDGSTS